MNNERVYKHLRPIDYLLVFLPMVFATILFLIIPIIWFAIEQSRGNISGLGGFDFTGLLICGGVFFWVIFCESYFLTAFILSILTRRNATFRTLLVAGFSLIVGSFYVQFLR